MTTPHSALRVLVIDDHEEVREHHRFILRTAGITQVVDAEDGRAAISILTDPRHRFDLILCDLQMPNLDGIETIRALSYMGVHGAVVILSVEEERVMASAGFLAEAHGLRFLGTISKPLTGEKLAETLRRLAEVADDTVRRMAPVPASPQDVERGLDADEFTCFYQPVVWVESGALYGVEALLRWKHPTRGLLTAESFMPSASGSETLMDRLAQQSLEQALAFAGRWRAAGHGEPVGVNVPGPAFTKLDLPERLAQLAALHGVPHDALQLEIGEQETACDAVAVLDVATRLRLRRFGVSMDQFGGTEFGLQRLQNAPLTEVKLGREFVHGCATAPSKQAVVEACVSLARNHRITSVAEGVRRRSDWEYLRRVGCDAGQGNYVVRALPEETVLTWAESWTQSAVPSGP